MMVTNLMYYAELPKFRDDFRKERESMKRIGWDPEELRELKWMDREQLMGLMAFCDIRTYNYMPIIACSDDELRMAYVSWRSYYSKERKRNIKIKVAKRAPKFSKIVNALLDIGTD